MHMIRIVEMTLCKRLQLNRHGGDCTPSTGEADTGVLQVQDQGYEAA